MENVLVTGAEGFLGYHLIKQLNERGIQPKALIETTVDAKATGLENLKVEIIRGSVMEPQDLKIACVGVDTVFHLKFEIAAGGSTEVMEQMDAIHVGGTQNILQAATEAGVQQVVVSSSSLAVGLNPEPDPIDESADWSTYQFNFPYAISRRNGEQVALAAAEAEHPRVVVVNPSFTMGPDDYQRAPANSLVKLMAQGKISVTAPIGFDLLDVRDYADGAIRAAQSGRHGQRYLLSGDPVLVEQLIETVAAVADIKPPKFLLPIPLWLATLLLSIVNFFFKLQNKPLPVSPKLLELWHRHAWYSTQLAQTELGWQPRPLKTTIKDTLDWMAQQESS